MAKPSMLKEYARLGANARLLELNAEIARIHRLFPDLAGKRREPSAPALDGGRKRRRRKPMTAAQRKAVGERMKKYWAARRKADKAKMSNKSKTA